MSDQYSCGATDENGLRVEREFINTIAYGVSCGVEFNSMAGLEAAYGRSWESRCPGKNLENIATIFKDLMKDSLESFYIFWTCCFTSFLTSFYLYYSTRVDQHAKKSMFYEISTLPPCMAQEFYVPWNLSCRSLLHGFAMLYDTLWHIQGRGAVVGVRGAVVGVRGVAVRVRGAAVGVRGAAVGNIGIPTYVISRGAVVRQPINYAPLIVVVMQYR